MLKFKKIIIYLSPLPSPARNISQKNKISFNFCVKKSCAKSDNICIEMCKRKKNMFEYSCATIKTNNMEKSSLNQHQTGKKTTNHVIKFICNSVCHKTIRNPKVKYKKQFSNLHFSTSHANEFRWKLAWKAGKISNDFYRIFSNKLLPCDEEISP